MTTVLYLLKDGDAEGAEDLRLSLRSLDHAFPDDEIRVAVATEAAPPWFAGRHVACTDLKNGLGKHWSMMRKVRTAIGELGLDEPFLLSSDDHIAPLEPPCRIADWPRLARKTGLDRFLSNAEKHATKWRRSVGWARGVVSASYGRPPSQLVMATHRNTWIDPRCLPAVERLFPEPPGPVFDFGELHGPSPDDTFGAVAVAEGLVREGDYVRVGDRKTADAGKFFQTYLSDKDAGRYGCSIPPGADAVRAPLWRIFRRPSRWERA